MPHRGNHFPVRHVAMLVCGGALSLVLTGTAIGQQGKALPVFVDGQAQIVPGFHDQTLWILQELWVETEFDSDGDGKRDRVHVDVTRPRQTDTDGLKVPVIYESSPYYGRKSGELSDIQQWDVEQEVDAVPPPRTPSSTAPSQGDRTRISNTYVETWVPRGFAVVHSESPGTGLSQGCPTVGGANESLASKAVIDWLNGRSRGFTTADGDDTVVASWSTGKVGMIGASYNGTLALAAATTGVDGLKAIVPIAAVSSWYDYYRSNGLVRHPGGYLGEDIDVLFDFINTGRRHDYCATTIRDGELAVGQERASGDYDALWAGRDYLAKVSNIKAAVLMVHGFNDWNVMPEQSVRIYEALKKRRAAVQVFYHQGGHVGDPPVELTNRWFTHYLYDVENGVEKSPHAWIVPNEGDETPTSYDDYPNPRATTVALHLQAGGVRVGGLSIVGRTGQGKEKLIDDVTLDWDVLAQAARNDHRLLYATPTLTDTVHLSGRSKITVRLASSKPAANLSVYLVALPSSVDSISKAKLITRGWADPQNYKSLTHGEPLAPGQFYTLSFNLQPDDKVIPAGARIGLMIFSSDRAFTVWPQPGTELTIDVDATSVVLPVVGGAAALERALKPAGH